MDLHAPGSVNKIIEPSPTQGIFNAKLLLIVAAVLGTAAIAYLSWRWYANKPQTTTTPVPLKEDKELQDIPFQAAPIVTVQNVERQFLHAKQMLHNHSKVNPSASYWAAITNQPNFNEYGDKDSLTHGVMLQPTHDGNCFFGAVLLHMLHASKSLKDTMLNQLPELKSQASYQDAITIFREKAGEELEQLKDGDHAYQSVSTKNRSCVRFKFDSKLNTGLDAVTTAKKFGQQVESDQAYAVAKWLNIEIVIINHLQGQMDCLNIDPNHPKERIYIANDGGGFEYFVPYGNSKTSINALIK